MKRGRVFLVGHTEGTLMPMDETAYASEDLLQQLLVDYPDLLPGDQINPEVPRRWLLVAREMGVPDPSGMGDRWSLDHLYLDQDGVPTFVECKRSSDTRIRREVVAQMLDYAANGLSHWSVERLRQAAEQTAQRRGNTLDLELQTLLDGQPDVDGERYWQQVADNLRQGKVRLLFVADSIPPELRRLVEFLNEKMRDVEVLAVEIKQFVGGGAHRVMVPRLIGMTETAREQKPVSAATKTTREAFLAACAPEAVPVFEQLLAAAEQRDYRVDWGKVGFTVRPIIGGVLTTVLCGWSSTNPPTRIEFYSGYLKLEPERFQTLRDALLNLNLKLHTGKHTYRATITPESAAAIRTVLPKLFALIENLVGETA